MVFQRNVYRNGIFFIATLVEEIKLVLMEKCEFKNRCFEIDSCLAISDDQALDAGNKLGNF